jgi:hypothetical protein
MRAKLGNSTYTVELDESDVSEWASRWPCYGERRPIAFEFERRNGDLCDVQGDDSDNDESGQAALANDCALAGAELLNLTHVASLRQPYADAEAVAILKARPRH